MKYIKHLHVKMILNDQFFSAIFDTLILISIIYWLGSLLLQGKAKQNYCFV